MDDVKEAQGTCLCGKITITVRDFDTSFGACHCDTCKVWTGGPQMAFGCGENIEIEGREHMTTFNSSAWAERTFCKECGTHLYYRVKASNDHRVLLGLFKDSVLPKFEYQYFIDKKSDNFSFSDETTDLTEKEILEYFASNM